MDPLELVMQAGPIVKFVMLLLLFLSLTSWFIIGMKTLRLMAASSQSKTFIAKFFSNPGWSPERLQSLYEDSKQKERSPVAASFGAGYAELSRLANDVVPADQQLENIERALERSINKEFTSLESLLPFLATTGSAAPFIGLFGTVWGIMNSFIAIHGNKNASLDVVAPGIAEALIATAIGLVAAIPAVIAYNFLIRKITVLESETRSFHNDYLNILRRHFIRRS